MSKEGRLTRVGVLAPAALSACMDASVLAVPAASAIVSTVLKELSKAFMLKKWFHGNISAKEAEQLMMERGKHGSFLVRESRGRPGDYVLTIRVKRRVSHVVIRKQDDKYDIGTGEEFDDLIGLIEHFRKFPIVETSGEMLRLLQPLGGICTRGNESEESDQEMKLEKEAHLAMKKEEWNKEFMFICLFDNISHSTTIEAVKPDNILKNRYKNIWPYDQTRVVLNKRDENDGDYINASYIRNSYMSCGSSKFSKSVESSSASTHSLPEHFEKVDSPLSVFKSLSEDKIRDMKHFTGLDKSKRNIVAAKEKVYIATQGCLRETRNDFWRMIWQEDIRIIVMVAKEYESGKRKCAKYWPDKNKKEYFDKLKVVCSSEKIHEEYLVRDLEVYDEANNRRTVYQYQYFEWPDHSAPERIAGLLSFIEDINECLYSIKHSKNSPQQVTLCVHCSAGIGRTGTFIALDMLLDKINIVGFGDYIDVFGTVQLIRSQRSGMVQNEEQYHFIYQAIEEYIKVNKKKYAKKNRFLCYKN